MVFALLLVTEVYTLERKSLFIDIGITIGTKGPLGIVLAYKYAFTDGIAVELFGSMFPATIPLGGFGLEINYYPEFLNNSGYVNLGISHVMGLGRRQQGGVLQEFGMSLWSVNAGAGANTGDVDLGMEEGGIAEFLYLELGIARVLSIKEKMGKEVNKVDKFLWISDGWYFPNVEFGLRSHVM